MLMTLTGLLIILIFSKVVIRMPLIMVNFLTHMIMVKHYIPQNPLLIMIICKRLPAMSRLCYQDLSSTTPWSINTRMGNLSYLIMEMMKKKYRVCRVPEHFFSFKNYPKAYAWRYFYRGEIKSKGSPGPPFIL